MGFFFFQKISAAGLNLRSGLRLALVPLHFLPHPCCGHKSHLEWAPPAAACWGISQEWSERGLMEVDTPPGLRKDGTGATITLKPPPREPCTTLLSAGRLWASWAPGRRAEENPLCHVTVISRVFYATCLQGWLLTEKHNVSLTRLLSRVFFLSESSPPAHSHSLIHPLVSEPSLGNQFRTDLLQEAIPDFSSLSPISKCLFTLLVVHDVGLNCFLLIVDLGSSISIHSFSSFIHCISATQ